MSRIGTALTAIASTLAIGFALTSPIFAPVAAEEAVRLPAARVDPAVTATRATAILSGGCFWGVEGVFSHTRGVISVESGYHGGSAADASYERIGEGDTGHAESVRIVYNPQQVSYGTLLRVFFSVVTDPTTLNRQGPDRGTQYRSAIVPLNATQAQVARAYLAQLRAGRHWNRPIVTAIEPAQRFYPAESYHQDFLANNPNHPYIRAWDAPKVAALRTFYPALWRAAPAP